MDLSQDFTCYPKRERFVFRPNHIEILERCFQEDSYPTYEKREEIARNCNTATEAMSMSSRLSTVYKAFCAER